MSQHDDVERGQGSRAEDGIWLISLLTVIKFYELKLDTDHCVVQLLSVYIHQKFRLENVFREILFVKGSVAWIYECKNSLTSNHPHQNEHEHKLQKLVLLNFWKAQFICKTYYQWKINVEN